LVGEKTAAHHLDRVSIASEKLASVGRTQCGLLNDNLMIFESFLGVNAALPITNSAPL
jgi:hypothetical protein